MSRNPADQQLLEGARKGKPDIVADALAAGASPLARHPENGRTALHEAATRKEAPLVAAKLLAAGLPIDTPAWDGSTALHAATVSALQTGNTTYIQYLLEQGADSRSKDNKGRTPLTLAKEREGFANFYAITIGFLQDWEDGVMKRRDDEARRSGLAEEFNKLEKGAGAPVAVPNTARFRHRPNCLK